jgi:disaggregatase-related protein/parallel beta helix pectate lyase-like protein
MKRIKQFPIVGISMMAVFFLATTGASADIIYVDASATGANDGSNWSDAFTELQSALAEAAYDDQIWAAAGTYRPDFDTTTHIHTGSKHATFLLIRGTAIYGGFPVGGGTWQQRNPDSLETILTGDLKLNDGAVNDPQALLDELTRMENVYHVVTAKNTDPNTILDGLTISDGNADAENYPDPNSIGAGIFLDESSLTVNDCYFTENASFTNSGAVENSWGNVTLTDCDFVMNATGNHGGAIRNFYARAHIAHCRFRQNYGWQGGAVANQYSAVEISDSMFQDNSGYAGGAIQTIYTIYNHVQTHVDHCLFLRNSAYNGGALFELNDLLTMSNCTFIQNTADRDGEAVYCKSFDGLYPSTIDIHGCILWDSGDEIANEDNSEITIYHSNIRDGWGGPGHANLNTDPMFANHALDDFHLQSQAGRYYPNTDTWILDPVTSPCIDTGDSNTPIGPEPFPNGGIVNMGYYGGTAQASKSWFNKPPCETPITGDLNGDCIVDLLDLRLMTFHWLEDHRE